MLTYSSCSFLQCFPSCIVVARVLVKITKYRLNGKCLVGWMCQTGVAVGMDLEDKMPYNEYYEYFGPDYTLHVTPSNMENQNSRAYLDTIRWTS